MTVLIVDKVGCFDHTSDHSRFSSISFETFLPLCYFVIVVLLQGGNFRMIIILPDEIDGLAELEAKLDSVDLFDELNYLQQPTVTVALPRFKLEKTMDLNDILKSVSKQSILN